jgi:hypothetical protein
MPVLRPRVDRAARPGVVTLGGGTTVDSALARLLTYVPVEVIAVYQASLGLLPTLGPTAAWVWFGFLLILCPLWIAFATRGGKTDKVDWFHIAAATVCFIVWTFAQQSGPFATLHYSPAAGSLVLLGASLLIPLLDTLFHPSPP